MQFVEVCAKISRSVLINSLETIRETERVSSSRLRRVVCCCSRSLCSWKSLFTQLIRPPSKFASLHVCVLMKRITSNNLSLRCVTRKRNSFHTDSRAWCNASNALLSRSLLSAGWISSLSDVILSFYSSLLPSQVWYTSGIIEWTLNRLTSDENASDGVDLNVHEIWSFYFD